MKKKWMAYREYLNTGDWHSHTYFTDGSSSVTELCDAAVARGLKLIAITEHVRRNLSYDFGAFLAKIQEARKQFPELVILAGCEAKVLNLEGDLDVSDDVLRRCDIVMGVFHSFPFVGKDAYVRALCNMLKKDYIDIWGHPTLFAARQRINLSQDEIQMLGDLCNTQNVLVERNKRYKLPTPEFIRFANVKNWIWGSNAHAASNLLSLEEIGCTTF